MSVRCTVRAIRGCLQAIQATGEYLAESGGSQKSADRVTREVKKISDLVTRLEIEIVCPLEKKCPLQGAK